MTITNNNLDSNNAYENFLNNMMYIWRRLQDNSRAKAQDVAAAFKAAATVPHTEAIPVPMPKFNPKTGKWELPAGSVPANKRRRVKVYANRVFSG